MHTRVVGVDNSTAHFITPSIKRPLRSQLQCLTLHTRYNAGPNHRRTSRQNSDPRQHFWDVLSARSPNVTGPFETVGKAAQLLMVAHPHHTGRRQQAEAAEPHLTVFHQITAEVVLTTPGIASLLQQAAAEQSFERRVDRHCVTGRTLALDQVQAAITMLLISSQLHHGVCL